MIRTRTALTALALSALLTPSVGAAQEAETPSHVPLKKSIGQVTPTGPVPSLYVLNADGASLAEGKLTLSGVSPNSIVFADRPVRAAGHLTTAQLIEQWDMGKDNFAIDPPNATVSVLGGTGSDISDAVVTLTRPVLTGDTLVFDVRVLEGALRGEGPAAVFIDDRGDGSASPELGNQAGFDSAGGEGGVDNNYDSPVTSGSGSFYHQPVLQGAWYRTHDADNAGMNDFQYGAGASIPFDSSE